jgi:glycosyltransferase involved in cell wall biosynthesis
VRVLHLLSDWKWTGPSEPVVRLCRALRERGVETHFFCMAAPARQTGGIAEHAKDLEPVTALRLKKKVNLFANLADIRSLAAELDRRQIDVVHVHTTHDHLIGSRAARKSARKPVVVRTNHTGVPLPNGYWMRRMVRGLTDGMVELSERAREGDMKTFGIPSERIVTIEGSVDLNRFHPKAAPGAAAVREQFGIPSNDVVGGIVARIQRHRRFDVLLKAAWIAAKECPQLKIMIVGRGTYADEVAARPAKKMGLANRVIFAGYRRSDYVDVLGMMDFLIYLMPGSDGSCRAAREAMAMGKPVIAARRGLLPELVEEGVCGLVVDDTAENLAAAMCRMAEDARLRRTLGANAAKKAAARFRIEDQVERIVGLYQMLGVSGTDKT